MLLFAGAARAEPNEDAFGITVLVAGSLTEAMTEITRGYSAETGQTISVIFATPEELAHSIEQGEPGDVFITEDQQWMKNLQQQGLVDVYSISNLMRNRLALVASKDATVDLAPVKDKQQKIPLEKILTYLYQRTMFVMGDPDSVPSGIAARNALQQLGFWGKFKPYIIRAGGDRQALYLITEGQNLGIIYASDANKNKDVTVLQYLPEELTGPIIYQAAAVAGYNMTPARKFLDYLKTPKVQALYKKYGFTVI